MKSSIKKIVRYFGFELNRYRVATSNIAKMQRILAYYDIDMILDVGANVGQFARSVRAGGYKRRIVSFEPLSNAYQKLLHVSRKDPLWIIAPQAAIGNEDGEITINISANSFSSSLLNVLETHVKIEPNAAFIGSEKVRLAKLDTIAETYLRESRSIFLKIDTQGFEAQVLAGAIQTLKKVKGLQIELSLVPLYDGQVLFMEMIEKIKQLGYELYGIVPGFTDGKTGRLLQADGIFFRE